MSKLPKNPMYRNGEKCTVICTDIPGQYPVASYGDAGVLRSHYENGMYLQDVTSGWDILETPRYDHIVKDTPVMVISKGNAPYPAYFAGLNYLGEPLIYEEGRTSHTAVGCNKTTRVWKVEVVS